MDRSGRVCSRLCGSLMVRLISRQRRAVLATLEKDLLQSRDRNPTLFINLESYSTMLSRNANMGMSRRFLPKGLTTNSIASVSINKRKPFKPIPAWAQSAFESLKRRTKIP